MKKLLGIVVLCLLFPNISFALDIIIACNVKKVDDDVYKKHFGMPGQTVYFKIKDGEVQSNWDEYNSRFTHWHLSAGIDNKYIKFYKWPGSSDDTGDIKVIDRESGKMISQNYVGQNKKYIASCDKIEEDLLPKKKAKQKF